MDDDMNRIDGRSPDAMREVGFQLDIAPLAHGSVLVNFGETGVICTAMLETGVPPWTKAQGLPGGLGTADEKVLPYSCAFNTIHGSDSKRR